MPENVLIKGADGLLGTHLVAHRLVFSHDNIFCLHAGAGDYAQQESEFETAVARIAQRLNPAANEATIQNLVQERVHSFSVDWSRDDLGVKALPPDVSKIWCLPDARYSHRHPWNTDDLAVASKLLCNPGSTATKEFNFVCEAYRFTDNDSDRESAVLARIKAECARRNAAHRIFRLSMLIGESAISADTCRDGFLHFLGTLHEFKGEIQERVRDYFEYQALRYWLPDPDLELNLVPVDRAVELMLRIAAQNSTIDREYSIGSPESIQLAELCDVIGGVYDLGLLPVEDRQTLNAVDRSFQERLEEFRPGFPHALNRDFQEAYRVAGADSRQALFDEKSQKMLLKAIRRSQDIAQTERNQRTAGIFTRFERRAIERNGSELTYYAGGSQGTSLVFLNALGQGLKYWERLVDDLLPYHRLLIWEPRGTVSPAPPFGLQEQIADLEAILEREKVSVCHLVGWCTGPKVAVDFYMKHPDSVLSMIFLNSTFKCLDTPADFDTDYERNFAPLCRVLQTHPNMAPSIMKSLQPTEEDLNLLDQSDSEQIAVSVLARMNEDLKTHVRAPFQTVSGIVNYAQQIMDFWAHDSREKAPDVKAPVLLFSSEYDQVASPEMSRMALQLFPKARHVHVRDATHYCLYDRPHFVAEVMEKFFRETGRTGPDEESEATEIACTSPDTVTTPLHPLFG